MKLSPIQNNLNQLDIGGMTVLFSYQTPVALCNRGQYYKTAKKWSNTTTRHVNKWLDGAEAFPVDQNYFDELLGDDFKTIPAVFYTEGNQ